MLLSPQGLARAASLLQVGVGLGGPDRGSWRGIACSAQGSTVSCVRRPRVECVRGEVTKSDQGKEIVGEYKYRWVKDKLKMVSDG